MEECHARPFSKRGLSTMPHAWHWISRQIKCVLYLTRTTEQDSGKEWQFTGGPTFAEDAGMLPREAAYDLGLEGEFQSQWEKDFSARRSLGCSWRLQTHESFSRKVFHPVPATDLYVMESESHNDLCDWGRKLEAGEPGWHSKACNDNLFRFLALMFASTAPFWGLLCGLGLLLSVIVLGTGCSSLCKAGYPLTFPL